MSALYGRLTSDRAKTQATRQGDHAITAQVENWHGRVTVALEDDGNFSVRVGGKNGKNAHRIASGKLREDGWQANVPAFRSPDLEILGGYGDREPDRRKRPPR